MSKVTGRQVQDAVKAAGLTWIDHHDCSICGAMVGYQTDGESLFFCSGCDCCWSPPRPTSWDEAAEHINMQTRSSERWGDVGARVAKRFGLNLPPEVSHTDADALSR